MIEAFKILSSSYFEIYNKLLLTIATPLCYKILEFGRAWWYTSIIPTVRRLRQEDCEFEISLSNITNLVSKQNKTQVT
jgi:hypothetical protein